MVRAIVTDIEGTTSAIDFVHNVLFPYAKERLPTFVRANGELAAVSQALADTAELSGLPADNHDALITQLLQWIAEDKKVTPLKSLQGLIWERGYREGDYQAHIYPDAAERLRQWHDQGLALYVYSSGSIYAQKLFFEFSLAGNLLPLFSGHFDTTTGPKQAPASYRAICNALGLPAEEILFLSDVVAELDAAAATGMQTIHVVRPEDGTLANPRQQHRKVASFREIDVDDL